MGRQWWYKPCRYPLAYCVSAFNFHQKPFIKVAKATLGDRKKAKVDKVGQGGFQLSAVCTGGAMGPEFTKATVAMNAIA